MNFFRTTDTTDTTIWKPDFTDRHLIVKRNISFDSEIQLLIQNIQIVSEKCNHTLIG